jgi:hypothetical protein
MAMAGRLPELVLLAPVRVAEWYGATVTRRYWSGPHQTPLDSTNRDTPNPLGGPNAVH